MVPQMVMSFHHKGFSQIVSYPLSHIVSTKVKHFQFLENTKEAILKIYHKKIYYVPQKWSWCCSKWNKYKKCAIQCGGSNWNTGKGKFRWSRRRRMYPENILETVFYIILIYLFKISKYCIINVSFIFK